VTVSRRGSGAAGVRVGIGAGLEPWSGPPVGSRDDPPRLTGCAAGARSGAMTSTRLAFRIHRWVGLLSGLPLLVVSLTGAVLVFAGEINEVLWRDLLVVPAGGAPLPTTTLYELVRQAHPAAVDIGIRRLPGRADRSVVFAVADRRTYRVFVDPSSGRILGRREAGRFSEDPMGWLVQLHFTLLAGRAGACAVGLLSVLLLLSIASGVFVYRRFVVRVLLFQVPIRWRDWRRGSSDLHRVVGVWAWLFNLIIAATGFWFMRGVFTPGFYRPPPPRAPRGPAPRLQVSLDGLRAAARTDAPDFVPLGVSIGQGPPGRARTIVFYGADRRRLRLQSPYDSRVLYDARTGALEGVELISRAGWSEQLQSTTGPLHFGSWGGVRIKVAYALFALAPPLLAVSGFALPFRRGRRL
jgi:uncharacterized iron-regulated membrane protein